MPPLSNRLKLIGAMALGLFACAAAFFMLGRDGKDPAPAEIQAAANAEAEAPGESIAAGSEAEASGVTDNASVRLDAPEPEPEEVVDRVDLIDPAARQRAEFFIGMMEQAIESGMVAQWKANNSPRARADKLVDALALRLGLDDVQQLALQNILLDNMNAREDPFRNDPELATRLLREHRDLVVEGTALRIMAREGELNEAQAAYGEEMRAQFTNLLGFDPQAHETVPRWLENEATLASIDATLAPEQEAELDLYIEETLVREKEQAAFRKSNRLANELGLSNEDRDSLYQFYYENPEATDEDLKTILDPSVHPILERNESRD